MTDYLNKLKFAVIPQEELEEIKSDLKELKGILLEKAEEDKNSEYIESVKIPKILGVSRKTYQEWRNKKLLSFVQVGSKIWIKRSDLEKFMKDHYIKAQD